ncbi:MAG: peptide chain release factor N(5)-glutamine methyltransferase [Treponema sp.]|nr:peptide chain release factor N(5)-glutamine methyltransferase [Treponema sp.]
MTVREAIAEGSAALAAAGIETPGLDASLLLAEVLGISRSSLITAAPQPLAGESSAAYNGLIKRRLAGECAAYILGRKEFYGLDFQVNPSVLVPRPDTETLVEAAVGELANYSPPARLIDLCTGCGAVAIALKHAVPETEVWATDISAEALDTAKANAGRLLPPGSIRFFNGDLFDALNNEPSPASIITGNPPYIPSAEIAALSPEVRTEPVIALDGGGDGLEIIRRIIARAPDFLCSGGALLLEADPRQMERIAVLLRQAGFTGIQTRKDLSGKPRVITGKFF